MAGLFVGRRNTDVIPMTSSNPSQTTPTTESTALSTKVNINTATIDELASLPGIGETLAQRIVAYREENGDYYSIYELEVISGIGDGKLEAIKDLITVG